MSIRTKWIALMLAVVIMLVGMQVYYGNIGATVASSAGPETTFDWWIYSGTSSEYYDNYAQNPAIQYTLRRTWGPEDKTIALNFLQPPPGSEDNNYTTMIASGDLPDIIDAVISEAPRNMVEKGYAIELTDYVNEYMPNYKALVHSNNEYLYSAVSFDEEGNEHYYALNQMLDGYDTIFQGYQYRRDWIVKYGAYPSTGEAFTGGYTDPEDVDSWVDDVVFPGWYDEAKRAKALAIDPDWDGTEPFFVSDWEWMFDIFLKAQAELGIEGKYAISLYYPGYTWSGGLLSCFGGGVNVFYQDAAGKVHFGGNELPFKTYLQAMRNWYEKGWLDQDFNQRTSDAFYQIDSTSVRQGLVGMWNGQQSELGGRLDMHDGGYTEGIYVAGAAYPINDIYGPEECQFVPPDCVMGSSLTKGGILITPTAAEKDLAALCSYLDYFYTPEGGLIKTLGLSAEQVAEFEDNTFYADHGLADGAYFLNDEGKYQKVDTLVNDSGQLNTAVGFNKCPGMLMVATVDLGYAPTYQASLDKWTKYPNTGFFQGSRTTNEMSQADAKTCDDIHSKVLEYMGKNCANFIIGKSNFEKDWDKWCTVLNKYKVEQAIEIYQYYVDNYPFR
ncbi:MAG: hypothetical protein IJ048_09195 [Clostridia bacterium]|nr:hypothetical protein [Clostridia bacterium]